jgi:hypothetical protein
MEAELTEKSTPHLSSDGVEAKVSDSTPDEVCGNPHGNDDGNESTISGESTEEEPLIRGVMMRCPWCKVWDHAESDSFTQLKIPPDFPKQTTVIYKHNGQPDSEDRKGCKLLFSLA